jgi:hypothetical protein
VARTATAELSAPTGPVTWLGGWLLI